MKAVTFKQIVNGLNKVGIDKDDHILVHSALSSFDKVQGGAKTVIEALLEVVGPQGTVVVPTFGGSGVFDPQKSGTTLGAIPAMILKSPNAFRSRHPLASVAAIGPQAAWLIENHEKAATAHGEGTPYFKLAKIGGKILLLGVDQDRSTFLHTVETIARHPYLRNKSALYIDARGKQKKGTWKFFPGPHRNFIGLQRWMEANQLVAKAKIGSSIVQMIPMLPLLEKLLIRCKEEPGIFISNNPNLNDGIWQKADIFRERIGRESFKLAADSQYSGQYLEEIIGNVRKYGIDNIMLSYINNISWGKIEPQKRKWYLQGIKLAGLKVAAIKVPNLPDENVVNLMLEAKVNSLIIPSTCPVSEIIKIAKKGFDIYIENVGMDGDTAAKMMASLQEKNGKMSLVFNPLEFAKAGQNPFLGTYRTKVKKFVNMIYINDGLFDGQRTLLEQGVAEIKELISIFRSRYFCGTFILQAQNNKEFCYTAEKFFDILKELGTCPKE